jgi:hypothetical protein
MRCAIQGVIDQFRADLGQRREINWDGVPDEFAAPNFLPGDFLIRAVHFSARRVQEFQVSADSSNPTGTPVRFGHINATYPNIFKTFSAERLFSPIGSANGRSHIFRARNNRSRGCDRVRGCLR